jgi:hypothetical protein
VVNFLAALTLESQPRYLLDRKLGGRQNRCLDDMEREEKRREEKRREEVINFNGNTHEQTECVRIS